MPTEVLYRKWRPQRFADVSGQEIVNQTLTNALKNGRVSHAYLFSGPRGTGKTTMGRLLTKAINCEKNAPDASDRPGEPCNECESCVAFNEGRALDLVELDGASNRGIDDIRELREKVGYAPMMGRDAHKVYLIDEVHMLTDPAFNALLKTLEEPPPHVVFILATTDAHRVPATITSRCQRQEFKRIPMTAIVDRLAYICEQEGLRVPREGLDAIGRASTGSLRDAINLLEQICDSYGGAPSLEAIREGLGLVGDERAAQLARHAARGELRDALATVGSVVDDGIDLKQFQKQVVGHLREMLLVQAGADPEQATTEQIAAIKEHIDGVPRERLVQALKLLSLADMKEDPLSPLPLELALAEALSPAPATAPATSARVAQPAPPAPATPAERPMGQARAPQQRPAPTPRTAPPERVPPQLRRDNITGASPEDIARIVGSDAPVISDEEPATTNGAAAPISTPSGEIDPGTWVMRTLYPAVQAKERNTAAIVNGSCHVVSWQDGILTLGFYADFYIQKMETASNKKVFEDTSSELLGAPVSIRCIIAPKPARTLSKSPLVQHAVENRGAKIVSPE